MNFDDDTIEDIESLVFKDVSPSDRKIDGENVFLLSLVGFDEDHIFSKLEMSYRLEESSSLVEAWGKKVIHAETIQIKRIHPATFIGQGTVGRITEQIKETQAKLLVVDVMITPTQQRNLEKELSVPVIDRIYLILQIFSKRARTHEGRLQVKLALYLYERSHLVRTWTHLERQRGALGFIGGAGEGQLELDKRLLENKMDILRGKIEVVKKRRELQTRARKKNDIPTIALVGYTNAGKSTLFNYITGHNVFAEDLLFATLDTTIRHIFLPSKKKVVVADSVGFISDLPTPLVAAFRSTLEEVAHSDILLNVCDLSFPHWRMQQEEVLKTLKGLVDDPSKVFTVYNKVDQLSHDAEFLDTVSQQSSGHVYYISAKTGEGIDKLLQGIDDYLHQGVVERAVQVDMTDGHIQSWLYAHGQVQSKKEQDDKFILFVVRMMPDRWHKFEKKFKDLFTYTL